MAIKRPLTKRQHQYLAFIVDFVTREYRFPTFEEIGLGLGVTSTNAVFMAIQRLVTKGYLIHDGVRYTFADDTEHPLKADDRFKIPIVANASLSQLSTEGAAHHAYRWVKVDPLFLRTSHDKKSCYIVQIGDDGMNAIQRNDYVIVEPPQRTILQNQDLVAFVLENQVIARRYSLLNGRVHLSAERRSYSEMVLRREDLEGILGRIVGVFRMV